MSTKISITNRLIGTIYPDDTTDYLSSKIDTYCSESPQEVLEHFKELGIGLFRYNSLVLHHGVISTHQERNYSTTVSIEKSDLPHGVSQVDSLLPADCLTHIPFEDFYTQKMLVDLARTLVEYQSTGITDKYGGDSYLSIAYASEKIPDLIDIGSIVTGNSDFNKFDLFKLIPEDLSAVKFVSGWKPGKKYVPKKDYLR